jgi:hypothetical protein
VSELAVNNFGDTRSGGLAGPMGLFIIVMMSIAVVLLIRNMNKRLRRLPDSFPDPDDARRQAEIAKLDADLGRPDAEPPLADAGATPPQNPSSDAKSEVSDVSAIEKEDTDGSDGRSA